MKRKRQRIESGERKGCVCAHVRSRMGKEHIYEYVFVRVCELVQVCVCV